MFGTTDKAASVVVVQETGFVVGRAHVAVIKVASNRDHKIVTKQHSSSPVSPKTSTEYKINPRPVRGF